MMRRLFDLLERIGTPSAAGVHGVLGVFQYVDDATDVVRALKQAGRRNVSVQSPIPYHEIDEALGVGPSLVRWVTFTGGVLGFTGGMALCVYSVYAYPLVVGGKELVSVPPFMIPTYESMILLGGLTNLIGMLALGRLPNLKPRAPYDKRFTEDRIGIWVPCTGEEQLKVQEMMKGHGAEEVQLHG
jgi:hypothetical protein